MNWWPELFCFFFYYGKDVVIVVLIEFGINIEVKIMPTSGFENVQRNEQYENNSYRFIQIVQFFFLLSLSYPVCLRLTTTT